MLFGCIFFRDLKQICISEFRQHTLGAVAKIFVFCWKFHALSDGGFFFENRLRYDTLLRGRGVCIDDVV